MPDNTSNIALSQLLARLANKTATIGIIGMGYVGLPLMLRFSEAGFRVIGFDSDAEKVAKLNRGESYIKHIAAAGIARARAGGFEASSDYSRCRGADAIILCVPTPLDRHREPDLSFVIGTTDAVVPFLRRGQVVSLESTTLYDRAATRSAGALACRDLAGEAPALLRLLRPTPGTTDEELLPRIQSANVEVGKDIFLATSMSPEREDPGNTRFSTGNIPKVCGGVTPSCLKAGVALYSRAVEKVVPVSSTRAAEMTTPMRNYRTRKRILVTGRLPRLATCASACSPARPPPPAAP